MVQSCASLILDLKNETAPLIRQSYLQVRRRICLNSPLHSHYPQLSPWADGSKQKDGGYEASAFTKVFKEDFPSW